MTTTALGTFRQLLSKNDPAHLPILDGLLSPTLSTTLHDISSQWAILNHLHPTIAPVAHQEYQNTTRVQLVSDHLITIASSPITPSIISDDTRAWIQKVIYVPDVFASVHSEKLQEDFIAALSAPDTSIEEDDEMVTVKFRDNGTGLHRRVIQSFHTRRNGLKRRHPKWSMAKIHTSMPLHVTKKYRFTVVTFFKNRIRSDD